MLSRQRSNPRLISQKISEKRGSRSIQNPLSVDSLRIHQFAIARTYAQAAIEHGELTRSDVGSQYIDVAEKIKGNRKLIEPVVDNVKRYLDGITDASARNVLTSLVASKSITQFIKIVESCTSCDIMDAISSDPTTALVIFEMVKSWTKNYECVLEICREAIADNELENRLRPKLQFTGSVASVCPIDVRRVFFIHHVTSDVDVDGRLYAPNTENSTYYYSGLLRRLDSPCSVDVLLETFREGPVNMLIGDIKETCAKSDTNDAVRLRAYIYDTLVGSCGLALKTLTIGYWAHVDKSIRLMTPPHISVVSVKGGYLSIRKSTLGYKTLQRRKYMFLTREMNAIVCEIEFDLKTRVPAMTATVDIYSVCVYPGPSVHKFAIVDAINSWRFQNDV